jgi:thioredoxin
MNGSNNMTADTFKAEVLESPVPVIVDFYADWCGPCRALAPILSELSAEASGKYKVVKVDVEQERQLANQYSVSALPTILLFKNGDVRAKLVGLQTKKRILEVMESHT